MSVIDRFKWLVFRRHQLKGIESAAHWLSYIDSATVLAGHNQFGKGTMIHGSTLGRHTYVAGALIVSTEIGAFCSIGPNVNLGGLGVHPTRWISTHPIFYSTLKQSGKSFVSKNLFSETRPNKVGNDVWIGANALIFDGVSIGDGAIIAAGAIVTKDVPPYAIVGGVPAKTIRFRFSEPLIAALLDWRWWDLPDEVLAGFAEDFCAREQWSLADIEALRAKVEQASKRLHTPHV